MALYIILGALALAGLGWAAWATTEARSLRTRLGQAREQLAGCQARLEALGSEAQERSLRQDEHFRALAADVLQANTCELRQQSQQGLERTLEPLRRDLDELRTAVRETYQRESNERYSLQQQIAQLVRANADIGAQARELAEALRGDSKVQGDWGEMVLRTIMERSGLRQGQEFSTQHVVRDRSGKVWRPDVVVWYPDGRCVVVDSKVSLTAYVELVNAETEDRRADAQARHVRSVRAHIDELAAKRYQDVVTEGPDGATEQARLDFVMMFIPNEPAYIAAMRADAGLWQRAYDSGVLIVSPTHLISALRLIEQLWVRDRQTRNAVEIAERAGAMYDKLAGFVGDMDRIERGLAATRTAYDAAMNKLSTGTGNLLSRAQKLREMGIKATKEISQRQINQP